MGKKDSLNGKWQFEMDPAGKGVEEKWFSRRTFTGTAVVPATIQEQEIGFLTRKDSRRTVNYHESFEELDDSFLPTASECYTHAWYARDIETGEPAGSERRLLVFQGLHPFADIYVDGELFCRHRKGPFEPCEVDISALKPGTHYVAVHLLDEGHYLQGVVKWPYFSGIFKDVYLEERSRDGIEEAWTETDPATGEIRLFVRVCGEPDELRAEIAGIRMEQPCMAGQKEYRFEAVLEDRVPWTPDCPRLYPCRVEAGSQGRTVSEKEFRFGFKKLEPCGKKILLNGRPFYFRGTGFGGVCNGFPRPGRSVDWYRRLVRRIKEYGFNYLRIHTFSMEQELLDICDEEGLFVQAELFSVFYETERERALTREQLELLLKRNRSHACVGAYVMGNEHEHAAPEYLNFRDALCRMAREKANGALVIDSDGVDGVASAPHGESDAVISGGVSVGNLYDVSPLAYSRSVMFDKPYLVHEFNYTESFPQIEDIPRYGAWPRPFWLEHARKSARENGCLSLLPEYVSLSRKSHYTMIRRAVEDVRKASGVAGFGHWGFIDFVHESIGLTNLFLEDKGGNAADFQEVNGPVIIAFSPERVSDTGYQGETFDFTMSLCNASSEPAGPDMIQWRLTAGGEVLCTGGTEGYAPAGETAQTQRQSFVPPKAERPYQAVLEAEFPGGVKNSRKLWFFPKPSEEPPARRVLYIPEYFPSLSRLSEYDGAIEGITEYALWDAPADAILITPILSDAAADYLRRGGRVLLLPVYYKHGHTGLPELPSSFAGMPSFAGTVGGCGTIISGHPVFEGFPHEGYCDMQFFDLIGGERAPHICVPFHHVSPQVFHLDAWPVKIEPILRSIPNWKKCANRAYLFEVWVGKGRLMACEMLLFENLFLRPEARWMMDSILRYMDSDGFRPKAAVTPEELDGLREPVTIFRL